MSVRTGWAAFFCNLPVNWTTSGLKQRKRTLNKELVVGSFRICSAGQPSELVILWCFWPFFGQDHKMIITALRFQQDLQEGKKGYFSLLSSLCPSLPPSPSVCLSRFPMFLPLLSFFSLSLSSSVSLSSRRKILLGNFQKVYLTSLWLEASHMLISKPITSQCLWGYHFGLDLSWFLSWV